MNKRVLKFIAITLALSGLVLPLSALAQEAKDVELPGSELTQTQKPTTPAQPAQPSSLVQVLQQTGSTKYFAQLLGQSGADQMLLQGGPYTIFAPSDNSLTTLPQNIVNNIDGNKDKIAEVLGNHIVKGKITDPSQSYNTMAGMQLKLTKQGNDWYVNGQKITKMVQYQNGIIYVIDGTIMPVDVMK